VRAGPKSPAKRESRAGRGLSKLSSAFRRRGRRNSRRARIRTYSSRASAHRSNCFGIP